METVGAIAFNILFLLIAAMIIWYALPVEFWQAALVAIAMDLLVTARQ